ncbi:MAG: hypothetical protein AAFV88_18905 [Planctomycetota bacterium]
MIEFPVWKDRNVIGYPTDGRIELAIRSGKYRINWNVDAVQ